MSFVADMVCGRCRLWPIWLWPIEKAIISPAAGLRAKSIISPAMFTYENPYLA